jgi:hypothetical protein
VIAPWAFFKYDVVMRQVKDLYPSSNSGEDLIKKLILQPDFQEAVAKFRDYWEINVENEIHLREASPTKTREHLLTKNRKFAPEIRKLQKRFKLGAEWFSFIEEYIFMDSFTYRKASSIQIETGTEEDADAITGKPAYYLRIFPETTIEDVRDVWPEVTKVIHNGATKATRQKPYKNFSRDKKIYKLAQLGWRIEDIAKLLNANQKKGIEYATIIAGERRYRVAMGIKASSKLSNRKPEESLTDAQIIAGMFPDE